MRAERRQFAAKFEAEGEREASRIRSEAELEAARIRAKGAEEEARIRGESAAQVAKTYADAHRINPELYRFTRSLESLDKLVTGNTSLILRTDSEPFSLLQSKEQTVRRLGPPSEIGRLAAPVARLLDGAWQRMHWWVATMAVLYAFSGITVVKSDEVAVILRWGRLVGDTPALQEHGPGLLFAFPRPIDQVVRVQVKHVWEVQVSTLAGMRTGRDEISHARSADGRLRADRRSEHRATSTWWRAIACGSRPSGRFTARRPKMFCASKSPRRWCVRWARWAWTAFFPTDARTSSRQRRGARRPAWMRLTPVSNCRRSSSPALRLRRTLGERLRRRAERLHRRRDEEEGRSGVRRSAPFRRLRPTSDSAVQTARGAADADLAMARGEAEALPGAGPGISANPVVVRERLYRDAVEKAIGGAGNVRWVPPPVGGSYHGFRITRAAALNAGRSTPRSRR